MLHHVLGLDPRRVEDGRDAREGIGIVPDALSRGKHIEHVGHETFDLRLRQEWTKENTMMWKGQRAKKVRPTEAKQTHPAISIRARLHQEKNYRAYMPTSQVGSTYLAPQPIFLLVLLLKSHCFSSS